MNKRRVHPRKSDINVTPLIDVLLVLLVIFMVISPVDSVGLPTDVPQPSLTATQPKINEALVLSLDQGGSLRINRDTLEISDLEQRLDDIFRTRADRTIFVQADNDLLFDEVAHVIDIAKGAGATRVGLLTESLR